MIEVRNLYKRYRPGGTVVEALGGISLSIPRKEFVTIMGPSGAGKSTLLHVLGLLDLPDDGEYLIEGKTVLGLPDRELARIRNRHFGFVFQSFNLIPELSALENVMLPCLYAGRGKKEAREVAADQLKRVGLDPRMHHYPSMLSGGEQQRTAVARALINNPDVVFADEPTGNLPTDQGRKILDLFLSLNDQGVTLVLVTHDPSIGALGRMRVHIVDGAATEASA